MTSVEDKENASQVETITIDDNDSEKKENIDTFFSPPKKKFKQDALPFTKLPKNEETPPKKDQNDMESLSDTNTIAERQLSELSNKQKSPANIQNSKNKKSIKNVSPKTSTSPKTVGSEKKVKASKASPVVGQTKDVKSDGIPFPKLSKEDALKESEKEVQNMMTTVKEKDNEGTPGKNGEESSVAEVELVDEVSIIENGGNCETPAGKKTPSSAKKVSPLSKEERQKLKEEKEMLKAARLKEMEEKKKKKEEEKILKQAEKEKRENERKEKERLREEEKKKKEEERKAKEEEKKKKEEERKAKEEEKQKKEELMKIEKEKKDAEKEVERKMKEEQKEKKRLEEEKKRLEDEALKKKKEKEANHFRSFFTKKRTADTKAPVEELEVQRFKPLPMKPDMLHAPLVRNNNINRELVDKILLEEIPNLDTYLKELAKFGNDKKTKYISRRKKRRELEEMRKLEINKNKTECQKKTVEKPKVNISMDIENVVVIDDNSNDTEDEDTENEDTVCDEKYLYISKLLQFSENTRPPYYGTWRKKSLHISGRTPFKMDKDVFNYDIDSDEEWIDEPGENLSDAADEDEEEEKETEDDQDGFFVPHGYLSDDEGIKDQIDEEDEDKTEDASKSTTSANSNTNDEDKLKLKVCTFERRFQRIKHHKPICIGITYSQNVDGVNAILKDYMKVVLFKPVDDKDKEKDDDEETEVVSPESAKSNQTPQTNVPMTVPEEAMPLLIKYVHGNIASLPSMIMKFREYWNSYAKKIEIRSQISKRQLEKKIQSIASRTGTREGGKTCYIVKDDVISKYGLPSDLSYSEGLPELKTKSTTTPTRPEQASSVIKDSNTKSIENEGSFDTSMEIN